MIKHLDTQGLPTANQMYLIPEAFKMHPSNFHNRGLYSLWAHFVEFCIHNSVFYSKKYRDVTSEPFFQVSAYRENPHIPGAKRLDVFVRLSMGKSFQLSTPSKVSSREPVMNALVEKQKNSLRRTWPEVALEEHLPLELRQSGSPTMTTVESSMISPYKPADSRERSFSLASTIESGSDSFYSSKNFEYGHEDFSDFSYPQSSQDFSRGNAQSWDFPDNYYPAPQNSIYTHTQHIEYLLHTTDSMFDAGKKAPEEKVKGYVDFNSNHSPYISELVIEAPCHPENSSYSPQQPRQTEKRLSFMGGNDFIIEVPDGNEFSVMNHEVVHDDWYSRLGYQQS